MTLFIEPPMHIADLISITSGSPAMLTRRDPGGPEASGPTAPCARLDHGLPAAQEARRLQVQLQ